MFKSQTVFVLGAGASQEAGLPIGKGLTTSIAALLDLEVERETYRRRGDGMIYKAVRALKQQHPDRYMEVDFWGAGREVAAAMSLAPSIDNFLQTHRENDVYRILGKMAIVRAIMIAEAESEFRPSAGGSAPFEMRNLGATWYVRLAQLLFTDVPASQPEVAFENVSFVVFNYDRCLEVFLRQALLIYFPSERHRLHEVLQSINIVHPYGSLGPLDGRDATPFGSNDRDLLSAYEGIRTFADANEDEGVANAINTAIARAETIIFLGFAFHEQNMNLIGAMDAEAKKRTAVKRVYATTEGQSESDVLVAKYLIGQALKGRPPGVSESYSIATFPGKCSKLFDEYWRSLSAPGDAQQRLSYTLLSV